MNTKYRPTRLEQNILEMEGYNLSFPYILENIEEGKCLIRVRNNPEREFFIINYQGLLQNPSFPPFGYDSIQRIHIELPEHGHFEVRRGVSLHRQLTDYKYTSAIQDIQQNGYDSVHTLSHYSNGEPVLEEYMVLIRENLFMKIRKYIDRNYFYLQFVENTNIPIPDSTFEFHFDA